MTAIGNIQGLTLLVGVLVCLAALYKGKIVFSKLIVALTLTTVAVLQLFVTPLDKRINMLEHKLAYAEMEGVNVDTAREDYFKALLARDPVKAWEQEVARLEKAKAELEKKANYNAGDSKALNDKLDHAKDELAKFRDPAAWKAGRIAQEERKKAQVKEGTPEYKNIEDAISNIKSDYDEVISRKKTYADYSPINLGIDLRGGQVIVLRLVSDTSRIESLQNEINLKTRERDALAANPASKATADALSKDIQDLEDEVKAAQESQKANLGSAVDIIRRKLNADGLSEIPVRKLGDNRIEIQLPGMDSGRSEEILENIKKQGRLAFRHVLSQLKNKEAYDTAEEIRARQENKDEDIYNIDLTLGRVLKPSEVVYNKSIRLYHRRGAPQAVLYDYLREPDDLDSKGNVKNRGKWLLISKKSIVEGEDLTRATASSDPNRPGSYMISVNLNTRAGVLMERFVSNHLATGPQKERMAIVLDDKLKSAPSIQGQFGAKFQITGSFTEQEAKSIEISLRSGSLRVKPVIEFRNSVGPTLGEDSIAAGVRSMLIGLGAVAVFMLVYYLFAGLVTNVVLMVNIIFIVAVLAMLDATMTLPGIAGLILTVGMSVDANVLIFERIREERLKGNALGRALQLGYERAFVTIVDANVTTLITAVILHSFGTEAIKGFAITLVIGIFSSMFCALAIARWLLEALIEWKFVHELKMLRIFSNPRFDFIRIRRPAMALSFICIAIGIFFVVKRGERNMGVDFRPGTVLQVALENPITMKQARELVGTGAMAKFADVPGSMQSQGEVKDGKVDQLVIRTSMAKPKTQIDQKNTGDQKIYTIDELKAALKETLPLMPEGLIIAGEESARNRPGVTYYRVELNLAVEGDNTVSPYSIQRMLEKQGQIINPVAVKFGGSLPETQRANKIESSFTFDTNRIEAETEIILSEKLKAEKLVEGDKNVKAAGEVADKKDESKTAEDKKAEAKKLADEQKHKAELRAQAQKEARKSLVDKAMALIPVDLIDANTGVGEPAVVNFADDPEGKTRLKVELTLRKQLSEWEARQALLKANLSSIKIRLLNPTVPAHVNDAAPASRITVLCGVPTVNNLGVTMSQDEQERVIRKQFHLLRESGSLKFTSPFVRENTVGRTVAAEMEGKALLAMVYAIVAIFFYIWLRFQFRAAFGAGAVIALIHDVLFTIGALAIADEFGLLNGQIDLVIVAALLTIVGYSLNDTIVVFDRIRENMLSSGRGLEEVINNSVNQTISRTVITSVTTLLVVLCLLIMGGDVIRGFAFSLFIGVLVGTYSSIFIASPILVEFSHYYVEHKKRKEEEKRKANNIQ